MVSLRGLALSCCILATLAGMIRIFWPENSFKPVINSVLLLYILASVVQTAHSADWAGFARTLRQWGGASATAQSYEGYAQDVAMQASAKALEASLADEGIAAKVTLRGGECRVTLENSSQYSAAQALLQKQAGSLPYTIEADGHDG